MESIIPQKISFTIGNGVATSFQIAHPLQTRDLTVSIRQAESPYAVVAPESVWMTTNDMVTVTFAAAPAQDEFCVTLFG